MPCEGCTHRTFVLNAKGKKEFVCKIKKDMELYIQGIKPCPFKEEQQ